MSKLQKRRCPQHEAWHRASKGSYRHQQVVGSCPTSDTQVQATKASGSEFNIVNTPDLRSLARALVVLAEGENEKK